MRRANKKRNIDALVEHARASVTGPWMPRPRDEWNWPERPGTHEPAPRLSWWVVAAMCGAMLWTVAVVAIVEALR